MMSEDNYYFKAKLADENNDRKLLISDLDFDNHFLHGCWLINT